MPTGHPKASEIWDGTVSFFSIDTDLIQAAGYRFSEGILGLLPKVTPATIKLLITEIVAREIIAHLLKPVAEAHEKVLGAVAVLKRAGDIPTGEIANLFAQLDVVASAQTTFRNRIEKYVAEIRGGILPIEGNDLAARLFELYFNISPPFEEKKDKKAEFPDAASLLLLEQYADNESTLGIVASKDGGAKRFAEHSLNLYHVESLDELSELFQATGAHAEAITAHLRKSVDNLDSELYETLHNALIEHVQEAEWDVEDATCSIVSRVETDFISANLHSFKLDAGSTKVWNDISNRATWVVELSAHLTVDVDVDVTFYVWDSVDKEELTLTSSTVNVMHEVQVNAFVTCSDALDDTDPAKWSFNVDIARGDYRVKVGEVNPDMG